jgi:hypothetical protein
MKTVEFPIERAAATSTEFDLRSLVHVLNESAFLLEASNQSEDLEFRTGSIELAVQALRAASSAIDRHAKPPPFPDNRVLEGPWS